MFERRTLEALSSGPGRQVEGVDVVLGVKRDLEVSSADASAMYSYSLWVDDR
jgi:hypothetical protein